MNERLSAVIKHPVTLPLAVGVVAFAAGGVGGYILGRRNQVQEYDLTVHELPQQLRFDEVEVQEFIARHEGKDEDVVVTISEEEGTEAPNPEAIVRVGEDFIERKIGERLPTMAPAPDPVAQNVFDGIDEEWDFETELAGRTEDTPFVIHRDEFYGQESGYSQTTLTYYAGDNIMVDEEDKPIYNHETVVGELKFGHGSGDPNVFHARNDKRKAEYEIIRDSGLYSVEVLGLDAEEGVERELRHSHAPLRKFRQED